MSIKMKKINTNEQNGKVSLKIQTL
uniref:Uncharacterized protein n=1 Tax=Anguilla anguilla TaxID=7936 RepID=A0A0E9R3D5_ANGAN